ncbi:MAG: terpene cyclase/mutase family protein [Planctomycetota bacterium]|nr:terpene cyclase/mutase family protein [Planctomycetota bacterium]
MGAALDKAIDFICAQVQPSSGYVAAHGTRMYSHAFATLALAEVYGVSRREKVRNKLQEAIEFTVKSQNGTGGWRYVPFTNDSDMSVTVCQVVALRAARNVGIKVPRKTIDRALRYVIESAITTTSNTRSSYLGAFWYQPHDQKFNRPSFALCAAGLTTLFQAGLYDDESMRRHIKTNKIVKNPPPSIQRSVAYMRKEYRAIHGRPGGPEHYFYYYGNYYAAQAMYQIGGKHPEQWSGWYRMVRDDLLAMMRSRRNPETGRPEVYWASNVDRTNAYATACALLILQFPLDHLPIHQR